MSSLQDDGLSHSEISGSKVICTYPELIAAYHVLHRLREPRHPPCALNYFLLISTDSLCWFPFPMRGSGNGKGRSVWYILSALFFVHFTFVQHVKDRMVRILFPFSRITKIIPEWRITDSNRWPSACKADALASWANPPRRFPDEKSHNRKLGSPRQSWTADLYIISVAL